MQRIFLSTTPENYRKRGNSLFGAFLSRRRCLDTGLIVAAIPANLDRAPLYRQRLGYLRAVNLTAPGQQSGTGFQWRQK
jgi:hypothetical protein